MPRRPPRILSLAVGLSTVALSGAAASSAHALDLLDYLPAGTECQLVPSIGSLVAGQALVDPLGYVVDTGEPTVGYATLNEGSTSPLSSLRTAQDAWDRFGALFVGGNQSDATLYRDPVANATGCSTEAAGRQVVFTSLTLGGLQVQRRLFVSSGTGSGVRLVDSVTNPTGAPVTTAVYVGDLRGASGGTLGSDSTTRVNATSTNDTTLSTADRWAVTSDGRASDADPALAHVWGSTAAADEQITLVRGAGTAGAKAIDSADLLDPDQIGWGWQGVSVAPGQTRSFMSWELMRVTGDGNASTQAAAAAVAAAEQASAPLSQIYEGMTEAQIAAVRNWAKPTPSATIASVSGASSATPTELKALDIDYGSSRLAACTTGSLEWDFGDGTTATGTGGEHRFEPGMATVALTITSTCGEVAVVHTAFNVAAPSAPESPKGDDPSVESAGPEVGPSTPTVVTAPAAPPAGPAVPVALPPVSGPQSLVPGAGPALEVVVAPTLSASQLKKRGVRSSVRATGPGKVRLVLSGGGLKIVKTKQVMAGVLTPAAMKVSPGDARRIAGLKTLKLRAKLTLDDGTESVSSRVISVKK